MKVIATVVAIIGGGFAIGVIGGLQLRPAASESLQGVVEKLESPKSEPTQPIPIARPGNAVSAFKNAAETVDLFERQWELNAALEHASPSQCYELLRKCDWHDALALQAVTERWASIDPDGVLEFLLSSDGVGLRQNEVVYGELFKTWSKSDPDGAVAAVRDLKPRLRDPYQRQIIGQLLYSDPELAIEVAADTRSVGHGLDKEFADWSDSDPAGSRTASIESSQVQLQDQCDLNLCRTMG